MYSIYFSVNNYQLFFAFHLLNKYKFSVPHSPIVIQIEHLNKQYRPQMKKPNLLKNNELKLQASDRDSKAIRLLIRPKIRCLFTQKFFRTITQIIFYTF